MDEDSRLLTKLDMTYSPVFDYRPVAFIVFLIGPPLWGA
jgi:hypothetical protein